MRITLSRLRAVLALAVGLTGCSGGGEPPGTGGPRATPETVTGANFEKLVLENPKPVLVDFWATWCGPCKVIAPIVEEITAEYEGKAVVGKLDIDAHPELAEKYEIRAIPALLIFKDGRVVARLVGVLPKKKIQAKLDGAL